MSIDISKYKAKFSFGRVNDPVMPTPPSLIFNTDPDEADSVDVFVVFDLKRQPTRIEFIRSTDSEVDDEIVFGAQPSNDGRMVFEGLDEKNYEIAQQLLQGLYNKEIPLIELHSEKPIDRDVGVRIEEVNYVILKTADSLNITLGENGELTDIK